MNRKFQVSQIMLLCVLLIASLTGLAGCSQPPAGLPAVPTALNNTQLPTIASIEAQIDEALTLYKDGKTDAAYEKAADAYAKGFEQLETVLGSQNKELVEQLEDQFKALRDAMKDKKTVAEIEKLVADLKANLDMAQMLLTK